MKTTLTTHTKVQKGPVSDKLPFSEGFGKAINRSFRNKFVMLRTCVYGVDLNGEKENPGNSGKSVKNRNKSFQHKIYWKDRNPTFVAKKGIKIAAAFLSFLNEISAYFTFPDLLKDKIIPINLTILDRVQSQYS